MKKSSIIFSILFISLGLLPHVALSKTLPKTKTPAGMTEKCRNVIEPTVKALGMTLEDIVNNEADAMRFKRHFAQQQSHWQFIRSACYAGGSLGGCNCSTCSSCSFFSCCYFWCCN